MLFPKTRSENCQKTANNSSPHLVSLWTFKKLFPQEHWCSFNECFFIRKFGLATTAPHLPVPAVKTAPVERKLASPVIQSTTPVSGIPLDRIATTISIISTTNPHDIQHIHIEKSSPTASTVPAWINFSDPSHFVISVILIFAIGFCLGMTLFVICRCICNRKPKVTKYKIVDPEAEDFLLGGTYGWTLGVSWSNFFFKSQRPVRLYVSLENKDPYVRTSQ